MSTRLKLRNIRDKEDYEKLLKQVQLNDLLKSISSESAKLFKDKNQEFSFGIRRRRITLKSQDGTSVKNQDVLVCAWRLVDLAYEGIITTNDYRGKLIEKPDEIDLLLLATEDYYSEKERSILNNDSDTKKSKLLLYLFGFAGEQVKFENPSKVFEVAAREWYILFESSKAIEDSKYNAKEIIFKETGVKWENIVCVLFLLWFGATVSTNVEDFKKSFIWNENLSGNTFDLVLERYTSSYQMIRQSKLGRQELYAKPYVRTSKNEIICVSCFLSLFLYEHSLLWIIRDYYKKQNDQGFTSFFGECFEEYFRELLTTYLNNNEVERIPEGKKARADWRISLGRYNLLVEQKSTLLRLSAKQQNTEIAAIEDFAERTIIKAIRQLKQTEEDYNDGRYIKIILLYEDYLDVHILEEVFKLKNCNICNDKYYWLVTIEEMEMLLHLYANDKQTFDKLMSEKISREETEYRHGRDLRFIMQELGKVENQYINMERISYYKNIAFEKALNHLPLTLQP